VDLNKEIKLSDLVRRPKKKAKSPGAAKPSSAKRKRRRKQEIVGLKIGASQIAASRVVNNGAPPAKLVQLARVPLEPGVVVGGEVRDVKALSAALDRFFTDNKLPRRGIRLGIGTNRIGVRTVDIEGVDDERQLGNVVRFRAHEALSIPLDQAVLDYHVVSETVDESGNVSLRVLLAAAYQEPIDHYVEACRAAGLELSGIDVEAFALLRAVAPRNGHTKDAPTVASVVVSIGHDRSTLAISDGTVCDFMRVLDWGGSKLEAAISQELGLTAPEAAELKLELDLRGDAPDGDDPRAPFARAAVERELQTLARELVASLHFYQGQPGSLAISEVIVTGGTTRLPGLAEELERLTRVPVRIANPLAGVQVSNGLAMRDDLASLAAAIGLGVEG
jgi:type IV pilus assembly protein PilM